MKMVLADVYEKQTKSFNLLSADYGIYTSTYIEEIVLFIKKMIENNRAYLCQGTVYLKTFNVEQEDPKSTITTNEQIQNKSDLILWSSTESNEPGWKSPFGYGRPQPRILLNAIATILSGRFSFSLSTFLIENISFFRQYPI
jgi:cysteinyl-tRNA synthetase